MVRIGYHAAVDTLSLSMFKSPASAEICGYAVIADCNSLKAEHTSTIRIDHTREPPVIITPRRVRGQYNGTDKSTTQRRLSAVVLLG